MTCRLRLPALLAAAGLVSAPLVTAALAQQQPAQQFGPRVQQQQQQQEPAAQQQGQRPQRQGPPPAVVLGKFGDWQLQCETQQQAQAQMQGQSASDASSAGGASGKSDPAVKKAEEQNCGLVQNTRDPKRESVQMSLIIASGMQNDKRVTMMRVIAPIGVFLPTGVALEIDGEAVGRVPFTRCLPQVCVAFAEASVPTLEKLKKGAKANFIIYEAPGLGISMPISLSGFTKGLEELEKL
jgi:invasion protein IalB